MWKHLKNKKSFFKVTDQTPWLLLETGPCWTESLHWWCFACTELDRFFCVVLRAHQNIDHAETKREAVNSSIPHYNKSYSAHTALYTASSHVLSGHTETTDMLTVILTSMDASLLPLFLFQF